MRRVQDLDRWREDDFHDFLRDSFSKSLAKDLIRFTRNYPKPWDGNFLLNLHGREENRVKRDLEEAGFRRTEIKQLTTLINELEEDHMNCSGGRGRGRSRSPEDDLYGGPGRRRRDSRTRGDGITGRDVWRRLDRFDERQVTVNAFMDYCSDNGHKMNRVEEVYLLKHLSDDGKRIRRRDFLGKFPASQDFASAFDEALYEIRSSKTSRSRRIHRTHRRSKSMSPNARARNRSRYGESPLMRAERGRRRQQMDNKHRCKNLQPDDIIQYFRQRRPRFDASVQRAIRKIFNSGERVTVAELANMERREINDIVGDMIDAKTISREMSRLDWGLMDDITGNYGTDVSRTRSPSRVSYRKSTYREIGEKNIWRQIDRKDRGYITMSEWQDFLDSKNITWLNTRESRKVFNYMDKKVQGEISEQDFRQFFRGRRSFETTLEAIAQEAGLSQVRAPRKSSFDNQRAFDIMDPDDIGYVNEKNFTNFMIRYTDEDKQTIDEMWDYIVPRSKTILSRGVFHQHFPIPDIFKESLEDNKRLMARGSRSRYSSSRGGTSRVSMTIGRDRDREDDYDRDRRRSYRAERRDESFDRYNTRSYRDPPMTPRPRLDDRDYGRNWDRASRDYRRRDRY